MPAAAAPPVPEWLTRHDGSLKPGIGDGVVFVMIGKEPQYRLEVRPAAGKFTCAVIQTVNGRQLGDGTTYPGAESALAGGLEQLRNTLGW
ncbi:MAG TPA: hypothetical protein VKE74_12800 [Gemmataceae bacterium]|nr:hypothetical protein [Gemmataceae bacterium]